MSAATVTKDEPRLIRVERTVAAKADKVWAMVADVTRMGEWSPETTGAQWAGDAAGPATGARFKGSNHQGTKSWKTDCQVTACEPGARFAFEVKAGPLKVARWTYDFRPEGETCVIAEQWEDLRGSLITFVAPFVTGVKDRASRNRETMVRTLDRLAAAAEQDASQA